MNGEAMGRFLLEATVPEVVSNVQYNGLVYARGTTVPADASVGYAKGCLFVHTDNTGETDILYTNIGTAASSNFNAITVAAD